MVTHFDIRARAPRVYHVLERWVVLPWVLVIYVVLQLGMWVADRAVPFRALSHTSTPVHPGETVRLTINVERELWRDCSTTFSRYMLDSTGGRRDLVSGQFMSADNIRDLDRTSPGQLILDIDIPTTYKPGLVRHLTSLEYECNPVHRLFWPIRTTMEVDFIVSPP